MVVGFDLFGDAVTWAALGDAGTVILCLTHGHPEHVGSLRAFLAAPEARARLRSTHVVSSAELVAFVNRDAVLPPSNVHAIPADAHVNIAGVGMAAFPWTHGSLLPRGLRLKTDYARRLLTHPLGAIRIGLRGLRVPMRAPTLGFRITFAHDSTLLNYSEGLHGQVAAGDIEAVAHRLPAQTLLFAIEPEDTGAVPRWVATMQPGTVVLYEAHRPWRDMFGMSHVDLEPYAASLADQLRPTRFRTLTEPGHTVVVEPASSPNAQA